MTSRNSLGKRGVLTLLVSTALCTFLVHNCNAEALTPRINELVRSYAGALNTTIPCIPAQDDHDGNIIGFTTQLAYYPEGNLLLASRPADVRSSMRSRSNSGMPAS